jgi:hypothetical protein
MNADEQKQEFLSVFIGVHRWPKLISSWLLAVAARLRELELEERDRRGYLAHPQREEEFRVWEDAAAWPEL